MRDRGVSIRMDGKERYSDKLFAERHRTVKYEEVVPESLCLRWTRKIGSFALLVKTWERPNI